MGEEVYHEERLCFAIIEIANDKNKEEQEATTAIIETLPHDLESAK